MWAAFKALPIAGKLLILIAIIAMFGSVYYVGYSKGKNISAVAISQYETKVSDLGSQLKTAQTKSTIKYITQYVPQIQTIERTKTVNHDVIKTSVVHEFNLTKGALYAINQSILGLPIDPALSSDVTDSGVQDIEAIQTISDNNADSLANSKQLESLQGWVKEQYDIQKQASDGKSINTDSVSDTARSGPESSTSSGTANPTDATTSTTTHN